MLVEKTLEGRGPPGQEQGGAFTVHSVGDTLNARWRVKRQRQQLLTVYWGPPRGRVLHGVDESLLRNDSSSSQS